MFKNNQKQMFHIQIVIQHYYDKHTNLLHQINLLYQALTLITFVLFCQSVCYLVFIWFQVFAHLNVKQNEFLLYLKCKLSECIFTDTCHGLMLTSRPHKCNIFTEGNSATGWQCVDQLAKLIKLIPWFCSKSRLANWTVITHDNTGIGVHTIQ